MKTCNLGNNEIVVSEIGFGAMDMTLGYGVIPARQDMIQLLGDIFEMGNHYTPEMLTRVSL